MKESVKLLNHDDDRKVHFESKRTPPIQNADYGPELSRLPFSVSPESKQKVN